MEKTATANSLDIIVETPKGSTEKYDYDPDSGFFRLNKAMPAGMAFPFDFGFIPNTKGGDGDPLDIMVISEFKTFSGCMVGCRIVGALKATQTEHSGEEARNDRFIGIPEYSQVFASVSSIVQLEKKIISDIQNFFINYNAIAGKVFKPLGVIDANEAFTLIKEQTHG